MAARGTGLPTREAGGVTPLADMSRGFGAAEAATAEGLGRLRASVAAGMQQWLQPQLNEKARQLAAADVEAGRWNLRMAITDDDRAYNDAVKAGALAEKTTQLESWAQETRLQHLYDPEGYAAAVRARRTALFAEDGEVPGWMAMDIGQVFDRQTGAQLDAIRRSRAERDIDRAERGMAASVEAYDRKLLTLDPDSFEFLQVAAQRGTLQLQRSENPAFNYTPEQAALDDAELQAKVQVAAASRGAIAAAEAAGGGLPGQAAAYRYLDDNILNNEALADVDPQMLADLWGAGRQQVDIFTRSDIEERRAQAEADRAAAAAAREAMGDWRLRVEMDEATEADILADETLTDAQQASLLRGVRARERRRQTDARVESLASYTGLADTARSGGLTDAEIADAVSGGLISQGQAGTLRRLRSTALRPIIGNVIAPVRDEAGRPGRSLRGTAEIMARAEADAATWAAANPEATLNEQMEFGQSLARRYFAPATNRPTAERGAAGQAGELRALSEERARRARSGSPMSTAEFNRRRTEIIHGR